MANLSFTTSGALPGTTNTSTPATYSGGGLSGLRQKMLNSTFAYAGNPSPAANALNMATQPPKPTTPVKKTTVTTPDGSSHVTEYHAPTTNSSSSSSAPTQSGGYSTIPGPYDPVTGMLKSEQGHATGTQSPTQNTQPTTGTTFPGILSSLANTSQAGSQPGQTYTQKTADYGAGNIPIGQSAKDIASDYGKRIADVGLKGEQFRGGLLTTGTSPVAQGNAAIAAQTTAAQQQALATGEEAALQGTGQQLTAQQQAANAENAAAGQANTAQGLEQSGLQQAGSLAQPSATAQGQTVFNPATGKFEGGSYQNNLSTVVSAIKNGQIGYTDGVNSLSGLSPTAKADVLAALGPGFDTVAADAAAAAKGSNIQTGGTATTGANAQGLSDSIKQETQLQTAATAASSLGEQVSQAMQGAGLNLTNSTDANTAINNLQSRLGNDAYTKLNIAVNDARSAYAAILQSSGSATPTEAGTMANQNISANMSPKQILAAIDQLSAGVKARQDAAHAQTVQFQNQLNSSGNKASSGNASTLNSTSAWPGF